MSRYLWRERESIELNNTIDANCGWHSLTMANCINNAGIMGGWGDFKGRKRGYLLIPKN